MKAETEIASNSEFNALQQLYCQEIERMFAELESLTQHLQGQPASLVAPHAKGNMSVLARFYQSNTLPVQMLDILFQYLQTMTQVYKHKLN